MLRASRRFFGFISVCEDDSGFCGFWDGNRGGCRGCRCLLCLESESSLGPKVVDVRPEYNVSEVNRKSFRCRVHDKFKTAMVPHAGEAVDIRFLNGRIVNSHVAPP